MIIKKSQVAAQLYTVQDHINTQSALAATLRRIKKIGYAAVELVEFEVPAAEIKKMLDDSGLVACSMHTSGESLFGNTNSVADMLSEVGAKFAALPSPGAIATIASVRSIAKKLDKAGGILAKAGISLTYHNHANEFVKYQGKTILEAIYELTSPSNLKAELDTYWVQAGGGDSIAWVKQLKGRLPLLHLKDYGVDLQMNPRFEEIGSGNLDWPSIVKAAKSAGCKWYIVEQDSFWERNDPFKSLKMSYDYIAEHLCS